MAINNGLDAEARQLLRSVRDARFARGLHCVRCGSLSVRRWGRAHGRQRYRCTSCRRTFSDLTDTPFMYSKRLASWRSYLACIEASETIRRSAARVGIHPSTAFRWRHRLLGYVLANERPRLDGVVEIATLRTRYSEKGARRRESEDAPDIFIICARDRRGESYACPFFGDREADFDEALSPVITRSSTVCTHGGRFSGGGRFARTFRNSVLHCGRHQAEDSSDSSLGHIINVAQEIRRLREWLRPFRGVATKYLENYLVWHRTLDRLSPVMFSARWVRAVSLVATLTANTADAHRGGYRDAAAPGRSRACADTDPPASMDFSS